MESEQTVVLTLQRMTEESKNKVLSKDVQLFMVCFKFAKCIGVAPPFSPVSTKLKKYAHVLYISTLLGIYVTFSIYEVIKRNGIYSKDESLSSLVTIMDVILDMSMFLSVATSLVFTVSRYHIWEDLLRRIAVLEDKFYKYSLEQPSHQTLTLTRTTFLLLSTVTLGLIEFLIHFQESLHIERYYIDVRIYSCYILFDVIIVSNVATLIRTRYSFLRTILVEIVTRSADQVHQELRDVQMVYAELNRLVGKCNEIFGWPIFYVPVNAILLILQSFNYCFFRTNMSFDLSWMFLATYVGISLNWFVLTIVVVMACDRVEKNGKKFTQTCYLLQEGMAKCQLRDELEYLAAFSEQLCPSFSAAGFYKVNQRVLAALFSIITTYSIICVQFNTTKK